MRRPGRPCLPPEERKSYFLRFRVTKEQKETFEPLFKKMLKKK